MKQLMLVTGIVRDAMVDTGQGPVACEKLSEYHEVLNIHERVPLVVRPVKATSVGCVRLVTESGRVFLGAPEQRLLCEGLAVPATLLQPGLMLDMIDGRDRVIQVLRLGVFLSVVILVTATVSGVVSVEGFLTETMHSKKLEGETDD